MKHVAALWAIGAVLLLLEGAAAAWLPRAWCPDLGLLLVVAAGLHLPGLAGCLSAWGVGWMTDLLSGSALGEYAILRLLAWVATRAMQGQFHLRRPLVLAGFVAGLTALDALALAMLGSGLDGAGALGPGWPASLLPHALANALLAPLVASGAARAIGWLTAQTNGPRSLRLPARSPLA